MKPFCWMLVGLPGVGKSTYINDRIRERTIKYAVLSSDFYIEREARMQGKTYNVVFKDTVDWAQKQFFRDVTHAIDQNENIIIDRTNLTVKSRAKILNLFSSDLCDYRKAAVVFQCSEALHFRRIVSRPDKIIPLQVMESMKYSFEMPTEAEGFDSITIIDCDKQEDFSV
jgi:tRNA uridine 5-carbamoylmethylation protein Kti12